MTLPNTARRLRSVPVLLAGALLVGACGASTAPTPDPAATGPGDPVASPAPAGNGGAIEGDWADEELLRDAVARLATLESFTYTTRIATGGGRADYLVEITGIERPLDGSRTLQVRDSQGTDRTTVFVDGTYWSDIGRGLETMDPDADAQAATDPYWIGTLLDEALSVRWDDFLRVGEGTVDGRPAIRYALSEGSVDQLLELMRDVSTWSAELWIDAEGGYLAKAHVGRQPFPVADFVALPEFTFELADVGCACPVSVPVTPG